MNRLTNLVWSAGGATVTIFAYQYNDANQRTRETLADGSYWLYQYDSLGQVTSAKKYWSDGTPVAGQQTTFVFDDIGNRKTATRDGRVSSYTPNLLNQYTSRTVPGYVNVLGEATNTATVSVGTQDGWFPTSRHGDYFRAEVTASNNAAPVWLNLTNLAVLNQGTNADLIATNTGHLLLARTPESFTYDLDGNLTSDSLWTNSWNGENRRVLIESGTGVPPVARAREQWTILPDGRWIERIVSTNNGSGCVTMQTNRFVWDGNVLLAVLNHTNGLELAFMRGLDLSGSLQEAGGVGGLLAVQVGAAGPVSLANTVHLACNDGNGNVMALVNAVTGEESARYEYGPFGELLRATGPMADINPIGFSTQYRDGVTWDWKYVHRDLDADTGRWRSRDAVEEAAGANVYAFVGNDPVASTDVLGRWKASVHNGLTWTYAHMSHGFNWKYSDVIAEADQGVDTFPPLGWESSLPLVGQQDRHMYYSKDGKDSRVWWYEKEFDEAITQLQKAEQVKSERHCKKAAEHFGKGLHSKQDKSAHRKWPGEAEWDRWKMHPGWWDAYLDSELGAWGLSEGFWNKEGTRNLLTPGWGVDYIPWYGTGSVTRNDGQWQSQEKARAEVRSDTDESVAAFEGEVRKTCFCRQKMLKTP